MGSTVATRLSCLQRKGFQVLIWALHLGNHIAFGGIAHAWVNESTRFRHSIFTCSPGYGEWGHTRLGLGFVVYLSGSILIMKDLILCPLPYSVGCLGIGEHHGAMLGDWINSWVWFEGFVDLWEQLVFRVCLEILPVILLVGGRVMRWYIFWPFISGHCGHVWLGGDVSWMRHLHLHEVKLGVSQLHSFSALWVATPCKAGCSFEWTVRLHSK